jgi:hypothetical protein
MVMDLATQVADKLRELAEEQQLLASLERDAARAVTQAIGGDGEARQELASLRLEIAERRRHIAEIEESISKILDKPARALDSPTRGDRLAQRALHEEQIRQRQPKKEER